jgi:hypothetical protein
VLEVPLQELEAAGKELLLLKTQEAASYAEHSEHSSTLSTQHYCWQCFVQHLLPYSSTGRNQMLLP